MIIHGIIFALPAWILDNRISTCFPVGIIALGSKPPLAYSVTKIVQALDRYPLAPPLKNSDSKLNLLLKTQSNRNIRHYLVLLYLLAKTSTQMQTSLILRSTIKLWETSSHHTNLALQYA